MKRIIALLTVFVLILTFSACGSSKKDKDLEQQYCSVAQQYIEKGDTETAIKALEEGLIKLPDSVLLKGLLDSIKAEATTVPETTKAPVIMTEETAINNLKELRKLYLKWFEDFTFAGDKSNIVYLEDYSAQYPVAENGIETYEDLRKAFTKYCDDALFNSFASRSFVKFKDVNGKLHAIEPEIMELEDSTDKDFKASKVSETEYKIVYNEFHSDYGDVYYYKVTLDYSVDAYGDWKFTNERRENMGYIDNADIENNSGSNNNSGGNKNNNYDAGDIINDVNGLVGDTIDNVGGLLNKYF